MSTLVFVASLKLSMVVDETKKESVVTVIILLPESAGGVGQIIEF